MYIKIFNVNRAGKIEFDKVSLEKLLNEVYNDGYIAGEDYAKKTYWTWSPSIYNPINNYRINTSANTTNNKPTLDNHNSIQVECNCSTSTSTTTPSSRSCTYNNSTPSTLNTAKADTSITEKNEPKNKKNDSEIEITINGKPATLAEAESAIKAMDEKFAKYFSDASSNTYHNNVFSNLAKEIRGL